MTTIYDIAKLANVSAMTVSRVINNTGNISDKTRNKVKRIMEELDYVPNQMARGLVTQQTRILFLLITDITNPFYTTLARGAEDAALKHGYQLLFGNSDENIEKESKYIETIMGMRVDGVLYSPTGDQSLSHLEALRRRQIPFILLDREVPGMECDVVLGDSKEGAKTLVQHFIDHGHQHIALVNGLADVSSARMRKQGYLEALKLNDLTWYESLIFELGYGLQPDLKKFIDWFEKLEPSPTAIFAGNNVIATVLIEAFQQLGLRIPEDISIACFDDLGLASRVQPFLTVVEQQAYQFGYMGTKLLIERIQHKEPLPWKKIILPVQLISRQSVATLHAEKGELPQS